MQKKRENEINEDEINNEKNGRNIKRIKKKSNKKKNEGIRQGEKEK